MNNQYDPNSQNNQQYQQYNYQAPQNNNYYQPGQNYNPVEEPPKSKGILSMVFGILSIYLGFIPGLVFAIIARRNASEILNNYPYSAAAKFAKVGKITGTIGIPVSIVSTLIVVFYIFIIFIYYGFLMAMIGSLGGY